MLPLLLASVCEKCFSKSRCIFECLCSEDSFLFVPCPLSSVTKMMTESVARNFQLLFDYVCDDDPRFVVIPCSV